MVRKNVDIGNFAGKYVKDKLVPHSKILTLRDNARFQTHKYQILNDTYQGRPISFIRDILGVNLTPDQQRMCVILENLDGKNPSMAASVVSSHNVGKTFLAACFMLYKLYCYNYALVLFTAPTFRQVQSAAFNTIREITPFPGDLVGSSATQVRIADKWFALGFTGSSTDAIAGLHPSPRSEGNLIVVDEASGIEQDIWDALDGIYSENFSYLAIGNPLRTNCPWYTVNQTARFRTMHISALNHPNIILELSGKPPAYPNAIRLSSLLDIIEKWCKPVQPGDAQDSSIFEFPPGSGIYYKANNLFLTRFMGQWPITGADSLFELDALEAIAENEPSGDDEAGQITLGVDIARFGADFTVIVIRLDNDVIVHDRRNGLGTTEVTGLVVHYLNQIESTYGRDPYEIPIMLDDTGIGGAVVDQLSEAGYVAIGVNFAEKATDPDKYVNARSEMYFNLADIINSGVVSTKLLNTMSSTLFIAQLTSTQYGYDIKGRYQLESKKLFKKRTSISPDDGDALALCFYSEIYGDDIVVLDSDLFEGQINEELDRYSNNRSFYST